MNVGWGAVALGAALLAGALLRLLVRGRPRPKLENVGLKEAVRLADMCREARALSSRKAWSLLEVHLLRLEEAVMALLERLEKEVGA